MEKGRHYCVVGDYNRKLTFSYQGEVIATTVKAKLLKEVGKSVYDQVFYIPKEDLVMDIASEPERNSHCPIKGDASYWMPKAGKTNNYFAWSYENALSMSRKIEGYIAFNPEYISFTSEPI